MNKAVLTMIAGTIGVGFLALPYLASNLGFFQSIVFLLICSGIVLFINLAYKDIVIFDKSNLQISGYCEKYLGSIYKIVAILISVLGSIGVLYAYSILAGQSIQKIFSNYFYLSPNFFSTIFVIASLFVVSKSVKNISKISSVLTIFFLILIFAFTIFVFRNRSFYYDGGSFSYFPEFFGSAIFSFFCLSIIPSLDELIGYNEKKYSKAIIISNLFCLVFYIFFVTVFALSFGKNLSPNFIDSFKDGWLSTFISIIIFATVSKSFILIANSIKEIFVYDLKQSKFLAIWALLFSLIFLLLFEVGNFALVISFVGGVALIIQSLLVLAIWIKLFGKKKVFLKKLSFLIFSLFSLLLLFNFFDFF